MTKTLLSCLVAITLLEAEQIGYHDVKTDTAGKIVPWHGAGPSEAYDHVIRLVWNFWINIRKCPNGLPYYLQHQVWRQIKDDPRGLGGDQTSMALSSWNLLYAYLGDPAVRENMIYIADYWLNHGMSKPGDLWPNLPYPYNTDLHSGQYDGDMMAGKGFLQPDKAGSFGAELLTLYKMTSNTRYRDAAVKIADTLASKVQAGDAENSPWPFRVNASTGVVYKEGALTATYTSNWTGALRLFRGLSELKLGRDAYTNAELATVAWLQTQPQRTNKWGPFFEDVHTSQWSDTEINADTLAAYILENPKWSPAWRAQSKAILDWTLRTFANHKYDKWGVIPINEQTAFMVEGNSHTARHASVELLYCEKTGDCSTKPAAIRRLNWSTYWVADDGRNRYPDGVHWMTDGYGDYVRHYLRAMASAPELAPGNQNHLLRASSTIQNIEYSPRQIAYTKFDLASVEMFKLGAWAPKTVNGGLMEWDSATRILTVRSKERTITISAP